MFLDRRSREQKRSAAALRALLTAAGAPADLVEAAGAALGRAVTRTFALAGVSRESAPAVTSAAAHPSADCTYESRLSLDVVIQPILVRVRLDVTAREVAVATARAALAMDAALAADGVIGPVSPHGGHPTLGEGERTLTGLVARLGIVPLELTRQALDVLHAGPFGSPLSPLDPREDTLTVLLLDHAGTPPEAVVDSNGAAALVDVLRAALGELPELPAVARSLAGKPVRVARPAPAGDPAIQAEV